jgi:hypothetical protein
VENWKVIKNSLEGLVLSKSLIGMFEIITMIFKIYNYSCYCKCQNVEITKISKWQSQNGKIMNFKQISGEGNKISQWI